MPPVAEELNADEFYEQLKARWSAVIAWDVVKKVPHTHGRVEAWQEFSKEWEDAFFRGTDLVSKLNPAEHDLNGVELDAKAQGYAVPKELDPRPETPEVERVGGRDIETIDPKAAAHGSVQRAVEHVSGTVAEVAGDAKAGAEKGIEGLAELWAKVPDGVKVAGGALLLGYAARQALGVVREIRNAAREAREAEEARAARRGS